MPNSNNLFPDETSGAQLDETYTYIPKLPIKPFSQQHPAYSPTSPVSESPAQQLEVERAR
jgi:hypothetical protein